MIASQLHMIVQSLLVNQAGQAGRFSSGCQERFIVTDAVTDVFTVAFVKSAERFCSQLERPVLCLPNFGIAGTLCCPVVGKPAASVCFAFQTVLRVVKGLQLPLI